MTNIQTKKSLSAIIIYHMWRNDAFTRFRCKHPFLTSSLAHEDNHNENYTTHKANNIHMENNILGVFANSDTRLDVLLTDTPKYKI